MEVETDNARRDRGYDMQQSSQIEPWVLVWAVWCWWIFSAIWVTAVDCEQPDCRCLLQFPFFLFYLVKVEDLPPLEVTLECNYSFQISLFSVFCKNIEVIWDFAHFVTMLASTFRKKVSTLSGWWATVAKWGQYCSKRLKLISIKSKQWVNFKERKNLWQWSMHVFSRRN